MRGLMRFSRLMANGSGSDEPIPEAAPPPLDASDLLSSMRSTGSPPSDAAPASPPYLARSQRLKTNLQNALDQVQHARSEAEQMADLLADYDAKARLMDGLTARNVELAQGLEDEQFRAADLSAKNSELTRELANFHEQAARAREAAEDTQRELSALYLDHQRDADRMTALSAQISALKGDLAAAREGKERAEVDGAGLRAALVERDQALRTLQGKESEWRLRAEKDAGQFADLVQASERKERRIAELAGSLEKGAKRIEELEDRAERAREEQRQSDIRFNDLTVSTESRIYTLTGSLDQEQAGHRVTRKLLEEMRSQTQGIADENKQLKDQAVNLAQENQQIKRELGGTRGTIREYGERLSEVNLRLTAAQDDIERLEGVISEGKKEARRLKRRANTVDDLQTENASLLDKIKSLQHTVDQYRAAGSPGAPAGTDAPIMLTPRRSKNEGANPITETAPIVKMPNAT